MSFWSNDAAPVNPPMALRHAAIFSDTDKAPNQRLDNPGTGIQDRSSRLNSDRMTG
jgi:hypothetical protein